MLRETAINAGLLSVYSLFRVSVRPRGLRPDSAGCRSMSTPVDTQRLARVLIISESGAFDRDWIESLTGRAEVRVVPTVQEALAVLRDEPYDLTLCASSQLPPLAQAAATAQTQKTLE